MRLTPEVQPAIDGVIDDAASEGADLDLDHLVLERAWQSWWQRLYAQA